jgi:hypothetical protein
MNLIPIFQRPKVWQLKMRKELIKNIVNGRPIPAIFMYKDVAGSAFTFNILDGKQRLDSIVLYLAGEDRKSKFGVKNWRDYILLPLYRKDANFPVDFGDGKQRKFADLDSSTVARVREYLDPTIEIELNENTSLNELINLFVDINQYGVKVSRVNIVRALKQNDPLLKDVYGLIAIRQETRKDVFTRRKKTPYVTVLKQLKTVSSMPDPTVQADRMWQTLLELALFVRSSGTHRKPTEILKSFITKPDAPVKLSKDEKSKLRGAFTFLENAYKISTLGDSRLAVDQTHFYTMSASLLSTNLLNKYAPDVLTGKLVKFAKLIDEEPDTLKQNDTPLNQSILKYIMLAIEKTTDASRRIERQKEMLKAIDLL